MKINISKKTLISIIVFISISTIVVIGLFSFLKPEDTDFKAKYEEQQKKFRIEDVPGVTNIERFSDAEKKKNVSVANRTSVTNRSAKPTPTPKPLPYPRIQINYTLKTASVIRNETAPKDYIFIMAKLDIKNYGYKYFDAHPSKFRLTGRGISEEPLVTVSTGNTLEEVIPNNSRSIGDLIFLLKKDPKYTRGKKEIMHTEKANYLILYNSRKRI